MHIYDLVRSLVTNTMLVALLFTLAQPKVSNRTLWTTLCTIVAVDLLLNMFFYMQEDYTTLALLDIAFFVLVGVATKPLFRETLMQWLFNCFTVMNIYAIDVLCSYYLSDFLPYPPYANTLLRVLLFASEIFVFQKYLRPLYRQAAEHWSIYLFVSATLFCSFAYYFFTGTDVQQSLDSNAVSLILLMVLTVLMYMAMFLSLRRNLQETMLREENLKIQADRELTYQRLKLMDESVRQMSIIQHDHRHFNNTLLALLQQDQTESAIELLQRHSNSRPNKPQIYCENIPVNAAISYYAELAKQREIHCDLRINIPAQLMVDELSLAMAVSNLLENAITAVSQLPADKRNIHFTAMDTGQLIMEVTNPYQGTVLMDAQGFPISQAAGHGKGTQSIRDFVAKNNGILLYNVSEGKFSVRMVLPQY